VEICLIGPRFGFAFLSLPPCSLRFFPFRFFRCATLSLFPVFREIFLYSVRTMFPSTTIFLPVLNTPFFPPPYLRVFIPSVYLRFFIDLLLFPFSALNCSAFVRLLNGAGCARFLEVFLRVSSPLVFPFRMCSVITWGRAFALLLLSAMETRRPIFCVHALSPLRASRPLFHCEGPSSGFAVSFSPYPDALFPVPPFLAFLPEGRTSVVFLSSFFLFASLSPRPPSWSLCRTPAFRFEDRDYILFPPPLVFFRLRSVAFLTSNWYFFLHK